MMLDDIEVHRLICDHLNLDVDLSSTDIIEMNHTPTSLDIIVDCGEVGKCPKRYEINISFSEMY